MKKYIVPIDVDIKRRSRIDGMWSSCVTTKRAVLTSSDVYAEGTFYIVFEIDDVEYEKFEVRKEYIQIIG